VNFSIPKIITIRKGRGDKDGMTVQYSIQATNLDRNMENEGLAPEDVAELHSKQIENFNKIKEETIIEFGPPNNMARWNDFDEGLMKEKVVIDDLKKDLQFWKKLAQERRNVPSVAVTSSVTSNTVKFNSFNKTSSINRDSLLNMFKLSSDKSNT
jgi:hypothetical protein